MIYSVNTLSSQLMNQFGLPVEHDVLLVLHSFFLYNKYVRDLLDRGRGLVMDVLVVITETLLMPVNVNFIIFK